MRTSLVAGRGWVSSNGFHNLSGTLVFLASGWTVVVPLVAWVWISFMDSSSHW